MAHLIKFINYVISIHVLTQYCTVMIESVLKAYNFASVNFK